MAHLRKCCPHPAPSVVVVVVNDETYFWKLFVNSCFIQQYTLKDKAALIFRETEFREQIIGIQKVVSGDMYVIMYHVPLPSLWRNKSFQQRLRAYDVLILHMQRT